MANVRRFDSKAALGQQRAELRRSARGKVHIGDDTGSAAGRAAERAKVHQLQEAEHERREAARPEPLSAIVADLVTDSLKLARTLVSAPFRMAAALRGRREAHA
ncbi:translation initiation factor IF-2 [Anaeromyxobacter diazotrophicus]|uniref:Uncharacterized protein n=1 Tax=Anaeromyxobacter diazotrophicus TaxID=2590199 RepID=A0A7I9VPU5_9BACT|nr:translation initiation factor IF-2 [Anaeromyxobacter diazotrophicus]GEJ58432.1 hypothetical protein AMYX_31730 [Anaeromyxobacter diazotrophicus]